MLSTPQTQGQPQLIVLKNGNDLEEKYFKNSFSSNNFINQPDDLNNNQFSHFNINNNDDSNNQNNLFNSPFNHFDLFSGISVRYIIPSNKTNNIKATRSQNKKYKKYIKDHVKLNLVYT